MQTPKALGIFCCAHLAVSLALDITVGLVTKLQYLLLLGKYICDMWGYIILFDPPRPNDWPFNGDKLFLNVQHIFYLWISRSGSERQLTIKTSYSGTFRLWITEPDFRKLCKQKTFPIKPIIRKEKKISVKSSHYPLTILRTKNVCRDSIDKNRLQCVFSIVGQGIFIVWSLLLSAGYFYIYSTMKKVYPISMSTRQFNYG